MPSAQGRSGAAPLAVPRRWWPPLCATFLNVFIFFQLVFFGRVPFFGGAPEHHTRAVGFASQNGASTPPLSVEERRRVATMRADTANSITARSGYRIDPVAYVQRIKHAHPHDEDLHPLNKRFRFLIINLQRRPDKLRCVAMQFAKYKLVYERIPAIPITDFSQIAPLYALDPNSKAHLRSHDNQYGHVGCMLSQLGAMMRVVADASKTNATTIIMEDDVHLEDNFDVRLEALFDELPADWDVVLLGWYCNDYHWKWCKVNDDAANIVSERLVKVKFYMANSAYALSPRGAQKILDSFPCTHKCNGLANDNGCSMAIDWHMSCLIQEGMLTIYGAMPPFVHIPGEGAIQGHGVPKPAQDLLEDCIKYVSDTEKGPRELDNIDERLRVRNRARRLYRPVADVRAAQPLYEALGFSFYRRMGTSWTVLVDARGVHLILQQNIREMPRDQLLDFALETTSPQRTHSYLLSAGWRDVPPTELRASVAAQNLTNESTQHFVLRDLDENWLLMRSKVAS